MAEANKIDPFDVEALERSLNDSATRVSTIWVSFLIFSLYLLTAATTVTHRQLFLAEPVKLPVLNIDLPLWGFFFLAPILFVIFHGYVLIQLILLARTAAAYDAAVAKLIAQDNLSLEANASLRQRLANTLFAQILAGSPREREGWFGSLLKAMAWITLVIAPILILLTFQFMFLPYHSHLATWTHRLLILLEFVVAFQLWPLVFNPQRDFRWPNWRWRIGQIAVRTIRLFRSNEGRLRAKQGLRRLALPMAATALFILLSLSLATFPGEPHINLFTGQSLSSVKCDRWFSESLDRLILPRVDVVDDEQLDKIERATASRGLASYEGERTKSFRERNFSCADLSNADLRRVDLTDARLSSIRLNGAALQGTTLDRAQLQGASLHRADLRDASLTQSQLRGAVLSAAQLQGVSLELARLQGASLAEAKLQGASLKKAQLQGADLTDANLQGALLAGAQLQGASLDRAQLQGASFSFLVVNGTELVTEMQQLSSKILDSPTSNRDLRGLSSEIGYSMTEGAGLQGASLVNAQLQGASLNFSQLQGANLDGANMTNALLVYAQVWRTRDAECRQALFLGHDEALLVGLKRDRPESLITISKKGIDAYESVLATPGEIAQFIADSIANIPDDKRDGIAEQMRIGLVADQDTDDTAEIAKVWRACQEVAEKKPQNEIDNDVALSLRNLICDAHDNSKAVARGVVRNWISTDEDRLVFSTLLAKGLLGQDGKDCAATTDLDETIKKLLRTVIAKTADTKPGPEPKKP